MSTMTAALYRGIEQIEAQTVERKPTPPGCVTVDTKRSGICGSDLHSYYGHWGQSETYASGHETCGVVVAIGEGVTEFKPGDRVTAECFSHCGQCVHCHTGLYNHCLDRRGISHQDHGGFAEYTTLHTSGVFKLPDGMSLDQGAMVEPLAVGYRAVAQSGATYPDRLAVIGSGTIGLLTLASATARGVRDALVTVKYPHQAEAAEAYGATHVVDVTQADLREAAQDASDGLGFDAVIDTVGTAQSFNDALAIVRRAGTIVLVAGYYQPLDGVQLGRIVGSEAIVTGSNCYGYSGTVTDFDASIDLIASGRVDVDRIITHRFALEDVTEAFRTAADKLTGSIKVHICQ